MNHAPARGDYSSLPPRCTTFTRAAWAQIVSRGRGLGWGPREERKGTGIRAVRSVVVAEQFAQKKTLWHWPLSMFVLEWSSKIQTERCLFLKTPVKGLFVPSLNPRAYLS